MYTMEDQHDLTQIEIFSDKDTLDRKLTADAAILCSCKGTAREVQACLSWQFKEGREELTTIYGLTEIEARGVTDVQDAMIICARNGLLRIALLAKKDK